MKALDQTTRDNISPDRAIEMLKEGNQRFLQRSQHDRNLNEQVSSTKSGQYPFATILSCIDSRVSSELIFDQGIGDIFSVRIAGNFINEDILGSMEFACKVAGTKLILVLGHTSCGAIKGACDNVKLGNLTIMLDKLQGAVAGVSEPQGQGQRNSSNTEFVNNVAVKNVEMSIQAIYDRSPVLKEMADNGEIKVVGGMYDISNGQVDIFS
jgi:carbonic anhydrase